MTDAAEVPAEMTQADFSRYMGVSRAAVSQWKTKDILKDDAFTKPGKKGKVNVAIAVDQVRQNRDIGQALGNGIETRTAAEPISVAPAVEDPAPSIEPAAPIEPDPQTLDLPHEPGPKVIEPFNAVETQPQAAPPSGSVKKPETVEDQLKRERLEAMQRKNRADATAEALRQGQLVSMDDCRNQMNRIAGSMLQMIEGAVPDIASEIAAKFNVPKLDAQHLLIAEFRKMRETAAKMHRDQSEEVEKGTSATIGD